MPIAKAWKWFHMKRIKLGFAAHPEREASG
jgi:hypothetical protein